MKLWSVHVSLMDMVVRLNNEAVLIGINRVILTFYVLSVVHCLPPFSFMCVYV